jgi:hypothetical protein
MRRYVFQIAILVIIFVALMSGRHSQTTSPVQKVEELDNRYSLLNETSSILNHPSDVVYRHGTTGHSITWRVQKIALEYYRVYRNNKLVESSRLKESRISIDIDGLDLGTYQYTVILFDGDGKAAVDTVTVKVEEFLASDLARIRVLRFGLQGTIILVAGTTAVAVLFAEYMDRRK